MATQPNPNATLPLQEGDTISQTIGCRHNYPELCKNNKASVCAFARKDGKCLAPPASWKKVFPTLTKS